MDLKKALLIALSIILIVLIIIATCLLINKYVIKKENYTTADSTDSKDPVWEYVNSWISKIVTAKK